LQRILIVDDSATIRKMVRASLRGLADAEFAEAANGLEAIEQVALVPIALIVLDLNMPDMHGVDVTTRGDDPSRNAAVTAGATHYLTKPFVPQVLLATARDLLPAAARRHA
jgi:two-component system, chemotaxis family, chemotaxis protein CheY